jgi:hypothetical protein
MNQIATAALAAMVAWTAWTTVRAQAPVSATSLPARYSLTRSPQAADDMTVSVRRDGAREVVEMSRPAGSARPKGWTSSVW